MHARLIALSIFSLFVATINASAQIDEHKFEVGGVFTSLTLTDFKARTLPTIASGDSTVHGLGGRLAYNLSKNFAIDAEGNFFPETHLGNEELGQKLQGFIGLKAGVKNRWAGVFAKARPGVMWFGDFSSPGSCTASTFGSACTVSHEKDFAMDLGGVVEFYPTERTIIRADIGDTIIHYPQRTFGQFNNQNVLNAATKNNFQVSLGFGWRF
ncbi:MAG TPA: outer membrane beta-barrel protein [Pyrinomonadaceae bacterium]|nr:outer membrane beta-barrel protein [Pyrinomonadaceae bacterium]